MAYVKKKPAEKKERKPKPSYKGIDQKVRKIILPGPNDYNIPSEELCDYTFLIHGAKGVGKTTAASTFPGNLTFMWEPFRRNVKLRMVPMEVKRASDIQSDEDDPWQIFIEYLTLAAADPTVKTITVDSVDLAYSACQEHVCFKNGIQHPSEKNDFGGTWNDIKFTFNSVFLSLKNMGKSLIFISHSKERDQEYLDSKGELNQMTLIAPSCAPACTKIMKEFCDFFLYYGKNVDTRSRSIILRDPSNQVDVACGFGFKGIDSIDIPNDPSEFYKTLNSHFLSTPRSKAVPKKPVRKLPVKKS